MLFFLAPSPSLFFPFPVFYSWSHLPLPIPFVRPLCISVFLSASFNFLCISVTHSDELEGQASPLFVDLGLRDMSGVYIYFFSIVVVIIIIIINIIMGRFKQTEKRRGVAVAQDSAREQRHNKGEESSPSIRLPLSPLLSSFVPSPHHSSVFPALPPSSLIICCPHSLPSQITMYFI